MDPARATSMRSSDHAFRAFLLIWPIVASLIVLAIAGPRLVGVDALADDVASRPPLAIMNIGEALRKHMEGQGSSPPKTFEQAEEEVRSAARRLREAGYIVLDAKDVFAYPSDFEATP